ESDEIAHSSCLSTQKSDTNFSKFSSYLFCYKYKLGYNFRNVWFLCINIDIVCLFIQDIPQFKEVIIMATVCPACGYRDSEVKTGGGVSSLGRRYSLFLTHISDLSRDLLKSDTASLAIPELDFEAGSCTHGGRFTTVEGILTNYNFRNVWFLCISIDIVCLFIQDIPQFKEVIIMATVCPACGYRDSEVKTGGGVSSLGRRYSLFLTHISDLSRDLLKSDTASLAIPELDFEAGSCTLGGRFTTVEGILTSMRDQLSEQNPFAIGDNSDWNESSRRLNELLNNLSEAYKISLPLYDC
ncbi:unnamed protein product, partial [Protopolystoma xenopodis]